MTSPPIEADLLGAFVRVADVCNPISTWAWTVEALASGRIQCPCAGCSQSTLHLLQQHFLSVIEARPSPVRWRALAEAAIAGFAEAAMSYADHPAAMQLRGMFMR